MGSECKPIDFNELNNNSDLLFYDFPQSQGGKTPGCLGNDDRITAKQKIDAYMVGEAVPLNSPLTKKVLQDYGVRMAQQTAIEAELITQEKRLNDSFVQTQRNYGIRLTQVEQDAKSGQVTYNITQGETSLGTMDVGYGDIVNRMNEKKRQENLTQAIEKKLLELEKLPPLEITGQGLLPPGFQVKDGHLITPYRKGYSYNLIGEEGHLNKSVIFTKKNDSQLYIEVNEYNGTIVIYIIDLKTGDLTSGQ